jgi:2-polyprenyl-3-methyl-5-hydroxy-6-metoxy-1,4-benzoquinol methylase
MAYRQRIYNKYASVHEKQGDHFSMSGARKYSKLYSKRFSGWLPVKKDAKILDLACGNGRMLFCLQQNNYSEIYGVDLSLEQVALARQVCDNVTQGDLFEFLEGKAEEYEVILAQNIIEHLCKDDAFKLLDLCFRALKKNGRLILSCPNADSPMFGSRRYGDLTHEICFTPDMLRQILEIVGFDNVVAREMSPNCHGLFSCARVVLWSLLRRLIQLYNLIEIGHSASKIYTRDFLISGVKKSC